MANGDVFQSGLFTGKDIHDAFANIWTPDQDAAFSTYSPEYGAASPLTFTSVSTTAARYIRSGKLVVGFAAFNGTLGGSGNSAIYVSIPVNRAASWSGGGCSGFWFQVATSINEGIRAFLDTTNAGRILISRPDVSNFPTSNTAHFHVSFFYEAA